MPTGMAIPLLKKKNEVTLGSSALSEILKSSTSDWSGFIQNRSKNQTGPIGLFGKKHKTSIKTTEIDL
jgi:hypothetical protein